MRIPLIQSIFIALSILLSVTQISCSQNKNKEANNDRLVEENSKNDINKTEVVDEKMTEEQYKVTFIELGSVRCIPCQKMQAIMKSIEEKYPKQVKVIFYDIWTEEGEAYADKYNVNLIPTQVFLDRNGKEFHRHQGFYPEEEIDKVLQLKGVK